MIDLKESRKIFDYTQKALTKLVYKLLDDNEYLKQCISYLQGKYTPEEFNKIASKYIKKGGTYDLRTK